MWLRILSCRDCLGFSDGPTITTEVLLRGESECQGRRRDGMMEAEVGVLYLEDGGGLQAASRSWKRKGNRLSPEASRRNAAWILDL